MLYDYPKTPHKKVRNFLEYGFGVTDNCGIAMEDFGLLLWVEPKEVLEWSERDLR